MLADVVNRTGLAVPVEYALQILHGLRHPELFRPGATGEERSKPLPGDGLVPDPLWEQTRAITIDAPPAAVWPWLVQMGWRRGGWYSWEPWSDTPSAERIVQRFQALDVGDVMLDGPGSDATKGAWKVMDLAPRHSVVLFSSRSPLSGVEIHEGLSGPPRVFIRTSWAFAVEPAGRGRSRLLVRLRARWAPARVGRPFALLLGLGDTVMERSMLEGIRERAEREWARARRRHPAGKRPSARPSAAKATSSRSRRVTAA